MSSEGTFRIVHVPLTYGPRRDVRACSSGCLGFSQEPAKRNLGRVLGLDKVYHMADV
jgi:hypothetical protein